jgi:hypothetical protein
MAVCSTSAGGSMWGAWAKCIVPPMSARKRLPFSGLWGNLYKMWSGGGVQPSAWAEGGLPHSLGVLKIKPSGKQKMAAVAMLRTRKDGVSQEKAVFGWSLCLVTCDCGVVERLSGKNRELAFGRMWRGSLRALVRKVGHKVQHAAPDRRHKASGLVNPCRAAESCC